jgi:hypothetical protein
MRAPDSPSCFFVVHETTIRCLDPETLALTDVSGSEGLIEEILSPFPRHVVHYDGYLYFDIPRTSEAGTKEFLVQRIPLAGGEVQTIAEGIPQEINNFAVTAGRVFFTAGYSKPLEAVRIDGTEPKEVAAGNINSLATLGDDLFVSASKPTIVSKAAGGNIDGLVEVFQADQDWIAIDTGVDAVYFHTEQYLGLITEGSQLVTGRLLPSVAGGSGWVPALGNGLLLWREGSTFVAQRLDDGATSIVAATDIGDASFERGGYLFVPDRRDGWLVRFAL